MWGWLSDLPVRWRLTMPALGGLLGLALVAVAAFGSVAALREANQWEDYSRDLLRRSASLESAFLVMVSEFRGYRLTAELLFLASYGRRRRDLDDEAVALQALVTDDAGQLGWVVRLLALVDQWQGEIAAPMLAAAVTRTPVDVDTAGGSELVAAIRA